MEILRLDGLCKQYPAFRLDNVSFSMEAGTIMGLIGRNGAGKTTTLKSMLHLVHPDAGQITICGLDMDTDERAIRSRIGFVSGGASYYQRKRLRELTDVTKDFYPGWDGERYARLVRQFSLDERKRVCELSEGMKVKYQLAVAMSHKAELLILDEPTSGLDPVSRDELLDTFLTLCEQEGVSILFSTHITSDLDACADTITYIQSGRVAVSGKKQALTGAYLSVQGPDAARENRDVYYMALLPLTKRDLVRARFSTIVTLQLLQALVCVPFMLLRSGYAEINNPVGIEANLAFLGFGFMLMGLFDLVFLPMHYKNGYDLGKPFVISSIVLFFAIVLLEALDHIVPYMKTVCESYASADLVRQLPVLLGGMAVYALEVWLAYRKSAARFEKVDL